MIISFNYRQRRSYTHLTDDAHRALPHRTTMNLLFWLMLILIAVPIGLHVRSTLQPNAHQTTLPDSLDPTDHRDWPLSPDEWTLQSLDFLATSDRIRAAVQLRLQPSDPELRRRSMEIFAHCIYRHLEVHAIFVEATCPGHSLDRYLFAADGRGWSGDKYLSTAFSSTAAP